MVFDGLKTEIDGTGDPKDMAETLKNLGNIKFKEGSLDEAIRLYTRAISFNNKEHTYFQNRALCYAKQGDWSKVVSDAIAAINREEESIKGHYLLGKGLLEMGECTEALKKLTKAKTLAEAQSSPYSDEIHEMIHRGKKTVWLQKEKQEEERLKQLEESLVTLLDKHCSLDVSKDLKSQVSEVIVKVQDAKKPPIPEFLFCKISMDLMKDPVVTPSGVTYERALLYEHFNKNGWFDPVTRQPIKQAEMFPNLAIKEATEEFLARNPWAFNT
eukprot:Platyproteum_vivax@DN13102_c0_g1_i1.p1